MVRGLSVHIPRLRKRSRSRSQKASPQASFRGFVGHLTGWRAIVTAVALSVIVMPTISGTAAADGHGAFLKPQKAIHAPPGFAGLCNRYGWVCKATAKGGLTDADKLTLARQINSAVNRQVREIEDRVQYGVDEHWSLPTRRGGDCEDLVLLKKKLLVERGVPSQALLIATVLDKRLNSHAVLVLRTSKGDLILDNLTNRIMPWAKTGYTFLKVQNPKSLSQWHAVMAGGVISDRPTASR